MKMHKWSDIKAQRLSPEQLAELDRQVAEESNALNLTGLREALGVTQVELAQAMETTQGQISRIESRTDHKFSTLRKIVEALGGTLELTAVVHDRRVTLTTDLVADDESPTRHAAP